MVQAGFNGTLSATWLDDGRLMELLSDFGFSDAAGLAWPVPKGARVDGASIPRSLWSIVGGPFEGKYRNASVVHDWYCSVRTRPWQAVHAMFWEAMLVSGVGALQARALYLAVRYGGPRWDALTVANNILHGGWSAPIPATPDTLRRGPADASETIAGPPVQIVWRRAVSDALTFAALAAQLTEDLSLAQIDALADAQPGAIVARRE
ncbi:DUF1353 domain-containing protein [Sandarakinorhabdus sp. DWP1-3-1]|uniref:DUF1353 domain-containing protein n=1 Tax=Sandarakinorhabdus sp. DWP1-3-1 TaxID=2804627 RepID=UPI003CE863C2